jgi:Phytanoyl-CoA dioxygenase (PhyH)
MLDHVLTRQQIEQFVADGYVALRGAVPIDVIRECQDVVWRDLDSRGIRRDDRSTWSRPVVRLGTPEGGPFIAAGTSRVLWETYDQLLGENTWWKRHGVGGTIPVRFPSAEDPGDAGWHIDGSFDGPDGEYWVNARSKMRGLLVLFLLTDVDEWSAPTRILAGSHLDVPRVLAPAGDDGMSFRDIVPRLPRSTFQRPIVSAVGHAGDVYVCHPFLVHAATWPHRGAGPRMVAQPGVGLREPFGLGDIADDAEVCPVETAILRGLRAS